MYAKVFQVIFSSSLLIEALYQFIFYTMRATPSAHIFLEIIIITITEKQKKYQELANEIHVLWKQDAVQVVPIVISATGIIPKSLSQSLKRLNLHPNTYIQMKTVVILGTCSIVRNFLNYT
jgi:hypothetical protein